MLETCLNDKGSYRNKSHIKNYDILLCCYSIKSQTF